EVCARYHTSWRIGAGGVAPYLREVRRVLLHSYREGAVRPSCVAGHQVVVNIEPTREGGSLVEDHLIVEVGSGIARVVSIAPLNHEGAVGSSAGGRVEDAAGGARARDRVLVHPHRAYGVGSRVHRHTGEAEARVIDAEAQFTVRASEGAGVGGVINFDREWEWNGDRAVIAADARVGGAGQIRACGRREVVVLRGGAGRGWGRRWSTKKNITAVSSWQFVCREGDSSSGRHKGRRTNAR